MYTIIGGDGKEYGPVSADQIRAWITAGRANLDTKARAIGTEEWKSLREFDDFNGGSSAAVPPVYSSAPVTGDADAIARELISRAKTIDPLDCYGRSWNLIKVHFWGLVCIPILVGFISVFIGGTLNALLLPAFGISRPDHLNPAIIGVLAVVFGIQICLAGVFRGGVFNYFLKKIRGQPTDVGDAFAGFSRAFVPLALGLVFPVFLSTVGFILFIIPGIYLSVAYCFTLALVIDQKLPVWTAMEVSRKVVSAQWWRMFLLFLLSVPFFLLGVVCLIVGVFIVYALVIGAWMYAYEDMCRPPPRL